MPGISVHQASFLIETKTHEIMGEKYNYGRYLAFMGPGIVCLII